MVDSKPLTRHNIEMDQIMLTYRRMLCFYDSIKSRFTEKISWDGHCWDVSGDGEIRCIKCSTRAKPVKESQ